MKISNSFHSNFIFENYDTVELAKRYGTPLYVISEQRIRNRCQQIKREFLHKYHNTKAAYASKAFLTMAMCKIIEEEGLGLDVVSGGELYTAIRADFPLEKVMFHGNNKGYEELELAIAKGVGRIVVDNEYELEMIEDLGAKYNTKVKILFRVTPGVEGNTHKYITTGQKDSKFGVPLEQDIIRYYVQRAILSPHIDLMGFHFHLGSQLFEKEIYIISVDILTRLMDYLKQELGFITRELNTGGGFGIQYCPGDLVKPLSYFTDAIMEQIIKDCKALNLDIPTIIIEPGRWIVGEAGITLYTIGAVKEIPNVRTYVSVDGGLPDNPRPALYKAKYHAIVANKADRPRDNKVTVAGKCCETGDILIWDLEVPKVEPGDILAVMSTGAYNYSMASNYNKLPRPAVLLLTTDKEEIIVERESYDNLLERERIPNHLGQKSYISQSAITKIVNSKE